MGLKFDASGEVSANHLPVLVMPLDLVESGS
jgi:hypothetical protein